MKKTFFIIRHGETDWNRQFKVQGSSDIPLNETGMLQAVELGEKLKNLGIEEIYSSDLIRARQTVEIINQKLDLDIVYSPSLRETHYGIAEGQDRVFIRKKYAHIFAQMDDDKNPDRHNLSLPEGETRNEVMNRFNSFIHDISTTSNKNNILVSTHGSILNSLTVIYGSQPVTFSNCACLKAIYCTEEKIYRDIEVVFNGPVEKLL